MLARLECLMTLAAQGVVWSAQKRSILVKIKLVAVHEREADFIHLLAFWQSGVRSR